LYLPKGISRVTSSLSFSGSIERHWSIQVNRNDTCILQRCQSTDHAESLVLLCIDKIKSLINKNKFRRKNLARTLQYLVHRDEIDRSSRIHISINCH
jgi:hypothetical protein